MAGTAGDFGKKRGGGGGGELQENPRHSYLQNKRVSLKRENLPSAPPKSPPKKKGPNLTRNFSKDDGPAY